MINRMRTFDGTDNSFGPGQVFKGFYRFIILNRNILRSSGFMQIRMFRADSRIIQPCRNGVYGINLALIILAEQRFHTVEYPHAPFSNGCRVIRSIYTFSGRFASNQLHVLVRNKMIEHAHGIASAAYTGQYGRRQPAFLFQNLLAGFLAYYRLKISDHHREWMWSHSRSNNIMCVIHTAYPFTHSFINRVLQHPGARSHGVYLSAKQFHAVYVQCLSLSIFLSHEYFTFQSQERRCRSGSHPMLPCTGFCNDTGLAHLFSQQALPQCIVNLMCSGVVQIFSLQIDFGSSQIFRHLLCIVEQ